MKAWTVGQSRRFVECARADDDPLYAVYVLMLVPGLRRGELLGLAWEDVDLADGSAWIGRQLPRVNGALVRRQTKTWSPSTLHPRVAMQILRHSKIAVTMEVYSKVVSASAKGRAAPPRGAAGLG